MNITQRAFAIGTALTAGFAFIAPAGAQSTGSSLEEIVVTARRVEERLQDVPISITVFTQDQLNKNNVNNAVDLASITPSLSVNNNFGNENTSFAIRGFVQDAGTAPSVGTYFGDVVAPRGPAQTQAGDSVGPGSFFDLQNIQVLKGPQGTLQGRNTTGGAVLLVPRKPTAISEAYAEVSAGNYGMERVQGMLNAPLTDAARFRIAVDRQKRDGWLHNISGIGPRDYNDVNYAAVRASLVLDLTTNLENYTIGSYSKSDTHGSVQKLIAASSAGFNPPNPAVGLPNFFGLFSTGQLAAEAARGAGFWDVEAAVPNPRSLIEQWQIINTTTWHASDTLTVKNIASYAEFKDVQYSPLFGINWQVSNLPAPYPFIFPQGIPAAFAGIAPPPGGNTAHQSTYTEELQAQGSALDARLTYQAGAYLEWSDPLGAVGNEGGQLLPCADVATLNCNDVLGAVFGRPVGAVNYAVGKTTFRDQGVYSQSSYSLTDTLKLTAGARYTWDKQTNTSTRITDIFPTPATPVSVCTDLTTSPTCAATFEKKSSKPTWMIDLDYKPADDMLLYGKYARGYRAGGIFAAAPLDHRTFNPEKVDNFEVGLKTAWHGAVPGAFNLAVFYNNFTDQQVQIGYLAAPGAFVVPTTAILNAGKSRIYGTEAELSISPVQDLVFDLNYTYLNAQIREIGNLTSTDPNYVSNSFITPGTPLALSPKNKAALSGTYTLPLDKTIGAISFGASFIYISPQLTNYAYLNPLNVTVMGADLGTVSSRSLLNLNLGWTSIFGSHIDVTAFGTNVTNKKYFQFIPGVGSVNSAIETAALGEPRMYGVRLRYSFGK
jgi:iron complex outermembrane receptor protein